MFRFLRLIPHVLFLALLAASAGLRSEEPAPRGGITGTVSDQATGLPLFGVEVTVADQPARASTDLSGRFKLEDLPPGPHTVLLRLDKFFNARVTDVVVTAGEAVALTAQLPPQGDEVQKMDEIVVTTQANAAGSRTAGIEERRNVAVSMEVFGKEDLAKFAVSDVAEAMVRIPGVSVASKGAFVVIRGLAERYNSATFNGIVLPSSDPERQSAELDQIPTRLIEGMAVYKNFAPDLPGNLSGGGVDVRTVLFPDKNVLSFTAGASTDGGRFDDTPFLTYDTARAGDAWGRGALGRVSAEEIRASAGTGRLTAADPAVPFTTTRHEIPAGKKFGAFYGHTFKFGGNRRLGVSAGLSYDSGYSSEAGEVTIFKGAIIPVRTSDGGFRISSNTTLDRFGNHVPFDSYRYERSKEKVQVGALGSLAFQFNDLHRLRFTVFTSQTGNDTAQYDFDQVRFTKAPYSLDALPLLTPDVLDNGVAERFQQSLHYRERNLTQFALFGNHAFPSLRDLALTWSIARNRTYQNEPDRRSFTYFRFYREAQYELPVIDRTWRRLDETQDNFQTTASLPFRVWHGRDAKVSVGGDFNRTERTYAEDSTYGGIAGLILEQPEDVSPYVRQGLTDAPVAVDLQRRMGAAFVKLDLPVTGWLDFSGGVRWDYAEITGEGYGSFPTSPGVSSVYQYFAGDVGRAVFWDKGWSGLVDNATNRAIANPNLKQWNVLPSATLTAKPTSQTVVRLSASQTLARPSLREMSNYFSEDEQGRVQHGNGFLVQSLVRNYDLRGEYFFEGTADLVAVSVFYKTIRNPIEKVQLPMPLGGGEGRETITDMWFNNPNDATVRGVELEFRKGLGFVHPWFAAWSLGGNATRIDASTTAMGFYGNPALPTGNSLVELPAWRSQKRRLYDQPTWLANGDLTWESKSWGTTATVSAVASDSVLSQVAWDGTQLSTYLAGTTRWDFSFRQKLGRQWSVKLTGKNLTDPDRKYLRDPNFLKAIGAELVDRRWHDGRSFTLTTTCEF